MSTEFSLPVELETLRGWLPVDAVVVDGKPGLQWLNMNGVGLTEPFFQETVVRARKDRPSRDERFTEFDVLLQLEKILDSVPPTGFIFHSSRCGSTLVANACRAITNSIVLSEADAIDKLVARFITDVDGTGVKETLYSVFLRGVVHALGQRRNGSEQHLFIKFSCCSTSQLERIRRIWPNVPWLFIYRDPIETMVSNLNTLPKWILDEDYRVLAGILGSSDAAVAAMDHAELCARALGSFYTSASHLANENSMLLNYRELSVAALLKVLSFFGVSLSPEEVEKISEISRFYSKDATGSQLFSADAESKRTEASDRIREMALKWAVEPYNRLEALCT